MRGSERQRSRVPLRAEVRDALIAGTLRHARDEWRDNRCMVAQRRPRMAPWGPTASSAETRAYVQQRLALFVKTMFWISWGLIGFLIAAYEVYPDARPRGADYVHPVAICGLILMGLIWITQLSRRQPPLEVLYAIDLVVTVGIGLVFGLSA